MDFEWDDAKAEVNERKPGITFSKAMTVFANPIHIISARGATGRERRDYEDGHFP